MKFYKIIISSENGFQAITDSPPKELLYKDLYSEYHLNFIDSIRLDLDKGKKITAVLNIGDLSLDGILINKKLCDIIKNYSLLKIQFVDIIDKDLNDYSFMFFNSDLTSKLDYRKSDFILVEDMLGDIEEIDVKVPKDREGVIKIYKEHCVESIFNVIIPKNGYHFISDFNINEYDVFRIGHFDKSFYVSERLKNILELNNITGVEFVEEQLFDIK